MRVKSFLRILIASNSNPFKYSQSLTNTNVPELSSNIVTIKTDNNYNDHESNDNFDTDVDEGDLKVLSTIFGLFYLGQILYSKTEGLRVKRKYFPQFKQPEYTGYKVQVPKLKIKPSDQAYYNNKRNKNK